MRGAAHSSIFSEINHSLCLLCCIDQAVMSTMNAAVGQSRSNQQGRDSARKVIAAYRKSAGLPHDLSFDEIADENLKSLTTSICFWLSARAIPSMGFDEQLQPIHPGNNRCLVPSTLVQYVGYWLVDVRVQFPQHADFQESLADTTGRKPTTPWWTDMRSGFLKAAQKFQMSLGEDLIFGLRDRLGKEESTLSSHLCSKHLKQAQRES
jgi:hypothetical protein